MTRALIFGATFLGGLFFVGTFLLGGFSPDAVKAAEDEVLEVLQVIGAFAVGMSLVSIGAVHGKRLVFRRKGWQYSLALFLGLVLALVAGFASHVSGDQTGFWWKLNWRIVFDGLLSPLGSSMFALLAFYMVSASFRAFRIRSAEAGLMMASAVVVMFAQMPPVQAAVPFSVDVKEWLLASINAGAQRAILIGSGLAGLVMSIRIWLGIERGTYFEQR